MKIEESMSGENRAWGAGALSHRGGVYRLKVRLPALGAPHEVVLHGVSRLADALSIADFFEARERGKAGLSFAS